ncbi:hypothetical protein DM860_013742 [Cuscuta australis]|uniref:START domain-containing protein n=1 Tax=Cuscuta australis TaxID=267555 RepID=A0A328DIR5_9ASTE|nr:hypothetical protein DM860_013742 [Cuscuta australis]
MLSSSSGWSISSTLKDSVPVLPPPLSNSYPTPIVFSQSLDFKNDQENSNLNFQSLLLSVSINADTYKERIMNLALSASEEVRQMGQEQEPLWLFDTNKASEVLNEPEYTQRFVSLDATLDEIIKLVSTGGEMRHYIPGINGAANVTPRVLKNQASRSIGIVLGSPVSLLDMLMDVEHWSSVFSNIVSKAKCLGVLYRGEKENHNGALQVMTAEFYLPSPLFKPQEVTWVENNNVVADNVFVHDMFKDYLLTSDSPFGSKRMIATMERYYDRMQSLERQAGNNHYYLQQAMIGAGNKNLLKLTQRMVRRYCRNVSERSWVALPISDGTGEEIFVKASMNNLEDDPNKGLPLGVSLTICTRFGNGCNRNKWDLLSVGSNVRDEMRISSARDPTNSVSVLIVESLGTTDQEAKIYLQESFTDSEAVYVVYAPVDEAAMRYILDGKDIDHVSILPSGFVILPASLDGGGGSILTICFQIMDDEQLPSTDYYHLPPQSVLTVHKLVRETISLIKAAFIV